jgi:HD-GYP domain-containing protein (c-di-GMP phosphodiesterase class II)
MYFAMKLGFAKDELLETAIAALLHDIGRFYFFKKTSKPVNIINHYEEGASWLLKYRRNLGELPVLVSFEHHIRHDLRGYPKVWFKNYRPHIVSELVRICDVYETFFQRRSLKYDYSPDNIYSLMMRGKGNVFHPELLDTFFRITGAWPVGTIVLLNDGRVAIVSEENDNDMFRPKITLSDFNIGKVIDLKETEGLKIDRALNPFGEGQAYLDLFNQS